MFNCPALSLRVCVRETERERESGRQYKKDITNFARQQLRVPIILWERDRELVLKLAVFMPLSATK